MADVDDLRNLPEPSRPRLGARPFAGPSGADRASVPSARPPFGPAVAPRPFAPPGGWRMATTLPREAAGPEAPALETEPVLTTAGGGGPGPAAAPAAALVELPPAPEEFQSGSRPSSFAAEPDWLEAAPLGPSRAAGAAGAGPSEDARHLIGVLASEAVRDAVRTAEAMERAALAADLLESVARRVRSGEIVVAAGATTGGAAAVLAAVLAALLGERG